MNCFVDTSALYAVMDASDYHHIRAERSWRALIEGDASLVTTNYVLLETIALLQGRLGMEAVKVFHDDVIPVVRVLWIDERDHQTAADDLLLYGKKDLSLVDCVSFHIILKAGIDTVFVFDRHFKARGFKVIP